MRSVLVCRRQDDPRDAELLMQGDEGAAQSVSQAAAQVQRIACHRQVDIMGRAVQESVAQGAPRHVRLHALGVEKGARGLGCRALPPA
jgi:hypothetical protein